MGGHRCVYVNMRGSVCMSQTKACSHETCFTERKKGGIKHEAKTEEVNTTESERQKVRNREIEGGRGERGC